jgi:hypothetical protein
MFYVDRVVDGISRQECLPTQWDSAMPFLLIGMLQDGPGGVVQGVALTWVEAHLTFDGLAKASSA